MTHAARLPLELSRPGLWLAVVLAAAGLCGGSPLHDASRDGQVDAMSLLLNGGANVDETTDDGATPLHFACLGGHVDAATLLLDRGADVTQAWRGRTPLDIATQHGHDEVARVLEEVSQLALCTMEYWVDASEVVVRVHISSTRAESSAVPPPMRIGFEGESLECHDRGRVGVNIGGVVLRSNGAIVEAPALHRTGPMH